MNVSAEEETLPTKTEVLAGFDRSLKELRLNQEGKLQFQSWEDFRNELREVKLLTIYDKSDRDSITDGELRELMQQNGLL